MILEKIGEKSEKNIGEKNQKKIGIKNWLSKSYEKIRKKFQEKN